jgi:hypothetical protein
LVWQNELRAGHAGAQQDNNMGRGKIAHWRDFPGKLIGKMAVTLCILAVLLPLVSQAAGNDPAAVAGTGFQPANHRVADGEEVSRRLYREYLEHLVKGLPPGSETNVDVLMREAGDKADAMSSSPERRAALVKRLKHKKDPKMIRWLVGVLNYPDQNGAYCAGSILTDLKYSGVDAFEGFLKMLQTANSSECRRLGAIGLGNIGKSDPQAIKALATAIADGWPQVQFEAVAALAKIGTPEADEALLAARKDSRSAEFRHSVDVLLGRKGHTNAVANLIQTLQRNSAADAFRPPVSRTNALDQASAAFGQRLAPVIDELGGASLPYKLTAAETLGRLGNEQAVEGLRGALSHSDPEVRAAAAKALGTALSAPSASLSPTVISHAIGALSGLTNDPDTLVRQAATNSVNLIRDSRVGGSKL